MPEVGLPVVQLRNVVKDYHGLRPLRMRRFELAEGQSVALLGFDAGMAEVLVNLLTAGSLPDKGEVVVFGEPTTAITDRESWVRVLDRFGLVSERGVLLDQLTAEQNLAMPLALTVHNMPDQLRTDVHRLAEEVRLAPDLLQLPLAHLAPSARLRIRLGRALALGPSVLLAEHPSATLEEDEAREFARDVTRIARTRKLATLVMTADRRFAHSVAEQVLELKPASGELEPVRRWWWR